MFGRCLDCSGGVWEVFRCVRVLFGVCFGSFLPVYELFGDQGWQDRCQISRYGSIGSFWAGYGVWINRFEG